MVICHWGPRGTLEVVVNLLRFRFLHSLHHLTLESIELFVVTSGGMLNTEGRQRMSCCAQRQQAMRKHNGLGNDLLQKKCKHVYGKDGAFQERDICQQERKMSGKCRGLYRKTRTKIHLINLWHDKLETKE